MIKAKKSLGQNFLIDKNILELIVNVTKIENKNILEVGPGTGNLTSFILKKKPKRFLVIEKDNDLAANLHKTFEEKLTIINDDMYFLNCKPLQICFLLIKQIKVVDPFCFAF